MSIKPIWKLTYTVLIGAFLSACGSPKSEFRKAIQDLGYIPYNTPLASAGVGTIVGGDPEQLRVATKPDRCFPNRNDLELRWKTETTLPSYYSSFQVGFGAELSDILISGNPLMSLNLSYNLAEQVSIEFGGASIEYMDELSLYYYHNLNMNAFCRQLLEENVFILQALRVESMKFTFFQSSGAQIRLAPGMIGNVVNMGLGTNWRINKNYQLIIDSPKYIGYQVGYMDGAIPGRVSHYAYELDGDDFDFVPVRDDNLPDPQHGDQLVTDSRR